MIGTIPKVKFKVRASEAAAAVLNRQMVQRGRSHGNVWDSIPQWQTAVALARQLILQ